MSAQPKPLDQVDPRGRIDVLAFRLADRIGAQCLPAEWSFFRPHVEVLCRELAPRRRRARKRSRL